jgi:hypothetical protein
MKLIISFVLFLLIQVITGVNKKFHVDYYKDKLDIFELQLKSDFTYAYQYRLGFKYINSEGSWKKEKNIIILSSSFDDLLKIPFTVEEKVMPQTNLIKFEIINPLPMDTICN